MVEVDAHLTDHVLPPLPLRQWVLSLPKRIRPFLPDEPRLACDVLDAAKSSGADAVGLSVVYVEDLERTIGELSAVRELLPASVPLLVGGGVAASLSDALEHPGSPGSSSERWS
jgi:hypothetical protein